MGLSHNKGAIPLIEKNLDKISWTLLCENENAMHILEKNPDKICWEVLSSNPGIFEYDYKKMKQARSELLEELVSVVFHPRNMPCFNSLGLEEFDYDPTGRLKLKD